MILEGPDVLVDAKDNALLHVFLINGPVSLIVSRMIIDTYGIKETNIFISCTRKTDTSIINPLPFMPNNYWYDRYFEKILSINLNGFRILNKILGKKQNFILYTAWAELGTETIIASKYCKGHIYLEEGQMAYWKIKPFRYTKNFSISRRYYWFIGVFFRFSKCFFIYYITK